MSLRLRFALAMALVAALVSAGGSVAVYKRSLDDRIERARQGVTDSVRNILPVFDFLTAAGVQTTTTPPGTYIEGPNGQRRGRLGLRASIPPELRQRISEQPGRIFSVVVRQPQPLAIAGTALPNGTRIYVSQDFGADEAELTRLRGDLVQIGIAATVAGLLVGIVAASLLLRRLRRAVSVARRFARGDFAPRIEAGGRDEIATLGDALDDMADALGAKIRELDQAAERERRFAADVAHELRTPITGLVAVTALLDESAESEMARERATALAHLVEDLLEVMRLEGGSEAPLRERFDLVRLVRDVARERAPGARIDAPLALEVESDPRRVERVVGNLVDNASRHGQPPISITVRPGPQVEVRDGGAGYGAFIHRAGDRFSMAKAARGGGTGLGLAIAFGQARVLGGRIDLRDDGGAVATLSLPQSAAVAEVHGTATRTR